jgi:hypothetical protein
MVHKCPLLFPYRNYAAWPIGMHTERDAIPPSQLCRERPEPHHPIRRHPRPQPAQARALICCPQPKGRMYHMLHVLLALLRCKATGKRGEGGAGAGLALHLGTHSCGISFPAGAGIAPPRCGPAGGAQPRIGPSCFNASARFRQYVQCMAEFFITRRTSLR